MVSIKNAHIHRWKCVLGIRIRDGNIKGIKFRQCSQGQSVRKCQFADETTLFLETNRSTLQQLSGKFAHTLEHLRVGRQEKMLESISKVTTMQMRLIARHLKQRIWTNSGQWSRQNFSICRKILIKTAFLIYNLIPFTSYKLTKHRTK